MLLGALIYMPHTCFHFFPSCRLGKAGRVCHQIGLRADSPLTPRPTHSLRDPPTHSFNHLLTHSFNHLLTYSSIHSLTHSSPVVHSLVHSTDDPPSHSLSRTHPPTLVRRLALCSRFPLLYSHTRTPVCLFAHPSASFHTRLVLC